MVGHFPLEGDGCVPALFHYIWSKNSIKQSCPLVNVPDTVVYKYRQACALQLFLPYLQMVVSLVGIA